MKAESSLFTSLSALWSQLGGLRPAWLHRRAVHLGEGRVSTLGHLDQQSEQLLAPVSEASQSGGSAAASPHCTHLTCCFHTYCPPPHSRTVLITSCTCTRTLDSLGGRWRSLMMTCPVCGAMASRIVLQVSRLSTERKIPPPHLWLHPNPLM